MSGATRAEGRNATPAKWDKTQEHCAHDYCGDVAGAEMIVGQECPYQKLGCADSDRLRGQHP